MIASHVKEPGMAGFAKLPTELLDPILELLTTKDLVSLCSVSSLLKKLATPLLYRSIEFIWRDEDADPP